MRVNIFTGDFKTDPYWWEAARPFASLPDLPESADLVIVGAGFCGLSAARRALELGCRPVVLDAGMIGGGASSRSGAMVSSGQKLLISGASRGIDSNMVRELTEIHAEAFEYVRELTTAGGIDAAFESCGRLFLAEVPRDVAQFGEHARILNEVAGMTTRVIGSAELRRELNSEYYCGGLLVEEFGGLHPSMFGLSLARDAERRGAILRSHTCVTEICPTPGGFIVSTEAGSIRTRHVLFATNGYTDAAMPAVRRRIAAVGSYIIATEEMEPDQVAAILPGRRMYSDTKRNLWFFRPSPDGRRILVGARPGLLPGAPEKAAQLLHRYLVRVFPALGQIRISHAWAGSIAMTRSHIQHIGQQNGVWFAVGCNGSGVAIMPWLGRLAVDRMLGQRVTPTIFERVPFRTVPNIAGHAWYVPIAAGGYGLMDWFNRKSAGF
jgi:glycine/D-amino acid oxidase-like deaminating enzyme